MSEKELIRRRGSYKARLTSFTKYIAALVDPIDSDTFRELQLRIGKIESLYEQYDEVQVQLECATDDAAAQSAERDSFESLYYKSLSRAQGLLEEFSKLNDTNDNINVSSSDKPSNNHKLVKLPTIQLPKFSGSYDNWLEFRDTFTSLIHSNDDIDNINKFHYLRTVVEGSAAIIIRSIQFSAENYNVAWDMLCERFDNKRLLIQNHVAALFNIDSISKESSVAIKRLIDQLNKNLRALESLNEPVKSWDTLLIYIVTQKLDSRTYRQWEEFKGTLNKNSFIKFDLFLEFLRNRADLVETLELSHNQFNSRSANNVNNNCNNFKVKSMVSVQSNDNVESSIICPQCKGDHYLRNCTKFLSMSVEERLMSIPSYKVCYNCLNKGHLANVCERRPGCDFCTRRHHTLIHLDDRQVLAKVYNDRRNFTESQPASPSSSDASDGSQVALIASVNSSLLPGRACEVLLSTALVKLRDSNDVEHVARVLLDSGSTSCIITENLSRNLNLPTENIDQSILGINNAITRAGKTCKVHVEALSGDYTTDVSCYVLPSISSDAPARYIDTRKLNIPAYVALADPKFYEPSQIDMLIGANLFWEILGSQKIKLGNDKPIMKPN